MTTGRINQISIANAIATDESCKGTFFIDDRVLLCVVCFVFCEIKQVQNKNKNNVMLFFFPFVSVDLLFTAEIP